MITILLVEDERLVAEDLREAISRLGHNVVVAHSASDAYTKLRSEPRSFSAILTDIDLGPGPSGFALIRRAQQLHPEIKVAIVSGRPANISVARRKPELLVFQKPMNTDRVAEGLDHLISGAVVKVRPN